MDGVVIIDKPAGWTSHDAVARVRRSLRVRRVGHTGTLDPFATGVLVVLVGRATRLAQFLAGAEKEYEASIRFGYATETGDATGARRGTTSARGETSRANDAPCGSWSRGEIEAALRSLRGEIEQVPPMYSAKKMKGRKLYELARQGIEVERRAARVFVREFEIVERDDECLHLNADGTCDLSVRVVCSAGTYVRALAESVGERLGAGAHLVALRRMRAGAFRIDDASSLDHLNELAEAGATAEVLLPPDAALSEMPFAHLTDEEAQRARHGVALRLGGAPPAWADGERVRLRDAQGRLLAIGVYDAAHRQLRPMVVLHDAEENKPDS